MIEIQYNITPEGDKIPASDPQKVPDAIKIIMQADKVVVYQKGDQLPQPSPEEQQRRYMAELEAGYMGRIQERLEQFAASRGYDSIISLCSYPTDPNPYFAAEGQDGVRVRSETWQYVQTVFNAFKAGERQLVSWEELEAELDTAVPLAWSVPDVRAM